MLQTIIPSISSVSFQVLSDSSIYKLSHVEVQSSSTCKNKWNTIYDTRMGVSKDNTLCPVCLNNHEHCQGHFGHITLEHLILHPFFKSKIKDYDDELKEKYHMRYVLIPPNTMRLHKEYDREIRDMLKYKNESSVSQFMMGSTSHHISSCISSHKVENDSITKSWKGKHGRIRGNLMGKRVNQCARSVISPSPHIEIDEVGVPQSIAKTLTKPIIVSIHNKSILEHRLRQLDESLQFVTKIDTKTYIQREYKLYDHVKKTIQLKLGWIIHRTLQNGDIVLMNRQPTLTRQSIMAHRVKITPYKTFQLNLSCTPFYNADFDGDEMNLHNIQGLKAEAEARSLMNISQMDDHIPIVQDTRLGLFMLHHFTWSLEIFMDTFHGLVFCLSETDGSRLIDYFIDLKREKRENKNDIITKQNIDDFLRLFFPDGIILSTTVFIAQQIARCVLDVLGSSITPRILYSPLHSPPHETYTTSLEDSASNYTTNDSEDYLEHMVHSGSKGKPFNITQIRGHLGEQYMDQDTIDIHESYSVGLKHDSYIAHARTGRNGVIDTSVNTAETGYIHRKLSKGLETFRICYDNTIRGHGNYILQYEYTWKCNALSDRPIDPGTMVGMLAVGAIGEPCTQMTLSQFHQCGIENETKEQGIPRLKSILELRHYKTTSIYIDSDSGRLDKMELFLKAENEKRREQESKSKSPKKHTKKEHQKQVKKEIKWNYKRKSDRILVCFCEKTLQFLFQHFGFYSCTVYTDDPRMCMELYGIEEANRIIFQEITSIMKDVPKEHVEIISNFMTMNGDLTSFHRQSFSKKGKDQLNPYEQASFEEPVSHLLHAGLHDKTFDIHGVSDHIMCGNGFVGGTNSFDILRTNLSNTAY